MRSRSYGVRWYPLYVREGEEECVEERLDELAKHLEHAGRRACEMLMGLVVCISGELSNGNLIYAFSVICGKTFSVIRFRSFVAKQRRPVE